MVIARRLQRLHGQDIVGGDDARVAHAHGVAQGQRRQLGGGDRRLTADRRAARPAQAADPPGDGQRHVRRGEGGGVVIAQRRRRVVQANAVGIIEGQRAGGQAHARARQLPQADLDGTGDGQAAAHARRGQRAGELDVGLGQP